MKCFIYGIILLICCLSVTKQSASHTKRLRAAVASDDETTNPFDRFQFAYRGNDLLNELPVSNSDIEDMLRVYKTLEKQENTINLKTEGHKLDNLIRKIRDVHNYDVALPDSHEYTKRRKRRSSVVEQENKSKSENFNEKKGDNDIKNGIMNTQRKTGDYDQQKKNPGLLNAKTKHNHRRNLAEENDRITYEEDVTKVEDSDEDKPSSISGERNDNIKINKENIIKDTDSNLVEQETFDDVEKTEKCRDGAEHLCSSNGLDVDDLNNEVAQKKTVTEPSSIHNFDDVVEHIKSVIFSFPSLKVKLMKDLYEAVIRRLVWEKRRQGESEDTPELYNELRKGDKETEQYTSSIHRTRRGVEENQDGSPEDPGTFDYAYDDSLDSPDDEKENFITVFIPEEGYEERQAFSGAKTNEDALYKKEQTKKHLEEFTPGDNPLHDTSPDELIMGSQEKNANEVQHQHPLRRNIVGGDEE